MANCTVGASCGGGNRSPIWIPVAVVLTAATLLLCASLAVWRRRRMRSRWAGATGGFGATVKPAWVPAVLSKRDPAGQRSTVQPKKGPTGARNPSPPAAGPPVADAHYENVIVTTGQDEYAQSASAEGEYMEYPSPADNAIYANGPCAVYSNCPTEDPSEDVYVFPD